MIPQSYKAYYRDLLNSIPKTRIFYDSMHILAYGNDASFYRLIPKIVVKAVNENEVKDIINLAAKYELPLTFRAAGTSLSGQAVSDSILVAVNWGFRNYKISEDASTISLEPGILGSFANDMLLPFGKKIGPDPASINSAMIGGIAANNASGMCCGVDDNSYNTLKSMRVILADGTMLDSGDQQSIKEFRKSHSHLIAKIKKLAEAVRADSDLSKTIRRKFKIKNTTGYSLNALIDFDDPIDILQHLMIGSEGTLGFISQITYKTVKEYKYKASALIIFRNIKDACDAATILKKAGSRNKVAEATELIDRSGLRSVEDKSYAPPYFKGLPEKACAVLIEVGTDRKANLQKKTEKVKKLLSGFPTLRGFEFTDKKEEYELLWDIRKGLYPTAGAMRRMGTSVIIEDISFPIDHLAEATLKLQDLFKKHGYNEAIIFGHILDGNLHFVFAQDFSDEKEVKRYEELMDDVVRMTADEFKGNLKAEHGTGRNMAPFLEAEWGAEAYSLMKKIKNIFDPQGILNPDVILSDDKELHLKNLKPLPISHDVINKCIECGFCESVCPSRELTLTPRQRIAVSREISALRNSGKDNELMLELEKQYLYYGEETCAVCGLCSTVCPVEIDTGSLTKNLRELHNSKMAKKIAEYTARNFSHTAKAVLSGLMFTSVMRRIVGSSLMKKMSAVGEKISLNKLPAWHEYFPTFVRSHMSRKIESDDKVVYFPSCISRTFAPSVEAVDKRTLAEVIESILIKARYELIYPDNVKNLCCGMAYSSKGFTKQAGYKIEELKKALMQATDQGRYPVLIDITACAYHSIKEMNAPELTIYDPIQFIYDKLLDRLAFDKEESSIAIHATCTAQKLGLTDKLKYIASLCATEVIVPKEVTCCGFAGDRGFNFPELNASALKSLKREVQDAEEGFSTSHTCEIGLSRHGEIPYSSILYLADRCSYPK